MIDFVVWIRQETEGDREKQGIDNIQGERKEQKLKENDV